MRCTYTAVDIVAHINIAVVLLCLGYLGLAEQDLLQQQSVVLGKRGVPLLSQLVKTGLPALRVAVQVVECVEVVDGEVRDALDAVHDLDDAFAEFGELVVARVLAHVHRAHLFRVGHELGYLGVNEVLGVRKVQARRAFRGLVRPCRRIAPTLLLDLLELVDERVGVPELVWEDVGPDAGQKDEEDEDADDVRPDVHELVVA